MLREEREKDSLTSSGVDSPSTEPQRIPHNSQTFRKVLSNSLNANPRALERIGTPTPTLSMRNSPQIISNTRWPSQNLDGPIDIPNPCSDLANSPDFNNRARTAFEDYSYDVDSQFPSPPPVNYAVPTHYQSGSLSPLRLPPRSLSKISSCRDLSSCRIRKYSPTFDSNRESTTAICQNRGQHIPDRSLSSDAKNSIECPDNPPTSVTSSEYKPRTPEATITTANNPEHPDHLAYLLSTAHIAPHFDHESFEGLRSNSFNEIPTVWTHDHDQSYSDYDNASPNIINFDGGIEEPEESYRPKKDLGIANHWANSSDDITEKAANPSFSQAHEKRQRALLRDIFDESELEQKYYEKAIDYEAEGKAYMENIRRRRREMQGRGNARAVT